MSSHLIPLLPKGFSVLETQVAGHVFSANTKALGMLKDENVGCVLKPMGKPECGARELHFYETLENTTDHTLLAARKFVPKFYKTVRLLVNSKEYTFLQLEDLTHGMQAPCIMDIKVGRRTYDPLASPKKRKVEEEKYSLCKQALGLCLPGFQVYNTDCEFEKYDKDFGKQLDPKGLRESIKIFLNAQHTVCKPLVRELLRQLNVIREFFRHQTFFHFYASSLLIIYDFAALQRLNKQEVCIHHQSSNGNLSTRICDPKSGSLKSATNSSHNGFGKCVCVSNYVKIKMIDFAHVFPANNYSIDTNYKFGLENLISILEDIDMLQR